MIDLCNQACEGMKMNQGRDAYQTIFSNILKTLLNLGKSESLFLFLYDENLAHILSHYFYQLQDYPEIQILIMRLSARLCSKVLMINHFMKHGLVLEIVKNVGYSSSSYFIKACVETITSFARQPQFVRIFILISSLMNTQNLLHT
jgi:AraC-like DNA-binding protein